MIAGFCRAARRFAAFECSRDVPVESDAGARYPCRPGDPGRILCPHLAWVAEDVEGVCGYLFAYPSRLGKVTPLDGEFHSDGEADCLYLHDLAVARRAAGRGIGPALVRHNLKQASSIRLRYSALVSVQDSTGFWSRLGYQAHDELEPPQAGNLASYQIPAVYMVRSLHQ